MYCWTHTQTGFHNLGCAKLRKTSWDVLGHISFVPGQEDFTVGPILFNSRLPSVKAATNLSGIENIFYFQSFISRGQHMVSNVKSPAHSCSELWSLLLLLLLSREGEQGRIIVDKKLSQTSEHNSYQNAEDNLNCYDINGKESGQSQNQSQSRNQSQSQSQSQSNDQSVEDLLQYHISCFRCYVCFKILKERYGNGAIENHTKNST